MQMQMQMQQQHDKYDYSDVTGGSAPSSPVTPVALYYVDSPSASSRSDHSHDDDKSSSSSPLVPSYQASPNNSPSPISADRPSSASRFSGRSSSSSGRSRFYRKQHRRNNNGPYWPAQCYAIREEGDQDDDEDGYYGAQQPSRPFQVSMAVLGLCALFSFFCLVLWAAAKPFNPHVTVKSFTLHYFNLGAGTDLTGVQTRILTLNCSMQFTVRNPATFFGIDLTSESVDLMYYEMTIATGQISKYYLPRKSTGTLKVSVEGRQVSLYGAGEGLAVGDYRGRLPVRLEADLLSTGNIIWKLLKVQHKRHISCALFIAKSQTNKPVKLPHDFCTFT